MPTLFLAADCGRTKIDLAAFDESGPVIFRAVTPGGVNAKITPEETIRQNIVNALGAVTNALPGAVFSGALGYFMHNQKLFAELSGVPCVELDEGTLGLYAAGITGDGVLILCGTGADAYVVKGGANADIIGGYGTLLGDEGSGFSIGQAAVNAAIRGYEGRGDKTLLTELLTKKYPADTFRQSVYGIYRAVQPPRETASFCRDCEKAADAGDPVALRIFASAADTLCSFALCAYDRYFPDLSAPYTFSGGVILHDLKRERPLMADRIISRLSERGIGGFVSPERDPVFGAVGYFSTHLTVFD